MITHANNIVLLGSCFSNEIGTRMLTDGFMCTINPFGQLYNPLSILASIKRIAHQKEFTAADFFEHEGLYHSFYSHTSMSQTNVYTTVQLHNNALRVAHKALSRAHIVIITLGSANVFLNDKGLAVANCHKLPAERFTRRIISPAEVCDSLTLIADTLKSLSPNVKIIITISPIRHMENGLHGNQVSKASLLVGVEQFISTNSDTLYFPSYEALLDDLRDYRFYATDLKHPSATAVDYIYEIFSKSFFDESTIDLSKKCKQIFMRLGHRNISSNEAAAQAFNKATAQLIDQLTTQHPELNNRFNLI